MWKDDSKTVEILFPRIKFTAMILDDAMLQRWNISKFNKQPSSKNSICSQIQKQLTHY